MAKLIYIFSLVIVCSVITADARQCYVCEGSCRTVDSSHIQTCAVPTIPTTPSTSTSTTIPTTPSTSTSDSEVSESSSSSSSTSTTSSGTTDPESDSGSSNGPSSETTDPDIDSGSSNGPSSEISDPGSDSGSGNGPSNEITDPGSDSGSGNDPSGEITDPGSDSGSGNGLSGEEPGSNGNENPPSGDSGVSLSQREPFFRGKRSVMQIREAERENSNIGCFEIVAEAAGVTNFLRGCYFGPPINDGESNEICQAYADIPNIEIQKCNICHDDLCNASEKATATIALIAASLISTFFYIKQ